MSSASGYVGGNYDEDKLLKIQIRSAQNVGKVWTSRKKKLPAPFGAIPGHFSMDQKTSNLAKCLPIFLGGPMGPIHPVWGHVLVSFYSILPE